MMASLDRAERAGNHLLRDGAEEVGRDQIIHVLLGQSKDFVLWRRKLVKDIIRFPFFFFSSFEDLSACCEQNGL